MPLPCSIVLLGGVCMSGRLWWTVSGFALEAAGGADLRSAVKLYASIRKTPFRWRFNQGPGVRRDRVGGCQLGGMVVASARGWRAIGQSAEVRSSVLLIGLP